MRPIIVYLAALAALCGIFSTMKADAQGDSQREYDIKTAWKHAANRHLEEGDRVPILPFSGDISEEALVRKQRSLDILESKGIPFVASLPVIETVAQSTRRAPKIVAGRALALLAVSEKGATQNHELGLMLINMFGAGEYLSNSENAYLFDPDADMNAHIQFSWRYEGLNVLMWALGYLDELPDPTQTCDVGAITEILRDAGPEGFFQNARLREQSELLDAADLIYRYDWAVKDAQIAGKEPPGGLNAGVVAERHYVLNWLIGYLDQDWDDVTTDT